MKLANQEGVLSSVKNALSLLRCFTLETPEWKVTDLAAHLQLGKSTVSRMLTTLASEGFVQKNPETHKYRLGLTILHLNTVAVSCLEVSREALPVLTRLVQETGETAHISVLQDDAVVYLNKVECKHPVKILTHVGRQNPAHCTSSGKIILAHQSEQRVDAFIAKGLQKYTPNTVTDPQDFKAMLQKAKKQGYAISMEEINEGVGSIAAPIRDYTGRVVYAVSVIGPVHRMNPHEPSILHRVKLAAHEISERLGYFK
ncbi:IclR family transcriptional regulator [Ectobacillus ponti]|uniref:Glycerol operon regulatory protein n=1 Tax=Ectobacillus ponti TaxID=2961894 RepID=A0AA41XE89_9BACI|nr:IclR family transcriptional regulator [Ectobacillus ponti]MCP8970501.1 IclR family transcriptional regulator [Ectobacillus ponti]